MTKRFIDINCDVGEGIGNEEALFPYISSCSVACGGHAGDLTIMRALAKLSKKHKVKLGAHPSYPDRENFGRVSMNISQTQLKQSIGKQLIALTKIMDDEQVPLKHIKPHGALYNDIASNKELARSFLEAVDKYRARVMLYVPYGSVIENEALARKFKVAREAFGDRNYNDDLSLVSRKKTDALIERPKEVLKRVVSMVNHGTVTSVNGDRIKIKADTICIHGDTPSALDILMYLSSELPKYNICIRK